MQNYFRKDLTDYVAWRKIITYIHTYIHTYIQYKSVIFSKNSKRLHFAAFKGGKVYFFCIKGIMLNILWYNRDIIKEAD